MRPSTYMSTSTRGFTLIELLVVIAIIGLLSSIVLASLQKARTRANDARRYSDLHQIGIGLELYRSNNSQYPVDTPNTQVDTSLDAVLEPTYMPDVPKDPFRTGNIGYRYCTDAARANYTLLAYIENPVGWCSVSTGPDRCGWSTTYARCD